MTFGERLRNLRNKINLSQQELSTRLGLNRARYARYETDDNQADYDTLKKLANYFEVTTDYLLGRVDKPHHTRDILEDAPEGEEVHFEGWDELSDVQKEKALDYIKLLRLEAEQYNKQIKKDGQKTK